MPVKIILNNRNLGFARAVNQGITASQGQYVLILNPDIIVLPGSIEGLYQFMQEHQRCAVAGPQLLNPDKGIQDSAFRFPRWYTPLLRRTLLGRLGEKHLASYLMKDWDHQSTREVDWLLGAALMVQGSAIKQVGPMDERFFLYFEDVEWCRRFRRANWQVYYVAQAQMYHFYQRSSAKNGWQALVKKITWIHFISAIKYFRLSIFE
ncbi:MAG: glycosyltransferase family 2 protein [Candidatus Parcubacteria bacterium]|nr:glycosyltransferase family 2 protein [Candidatus Parcubacteria bacterium]